MRGSGSRSASGSEIYERLPADTGSLGEDLEDRLRISCSDEDVDCGDDIYLLNQRNGSEHLVKPSQLKHQHHHNKQRSSKGQRAPPPPGKHIFIFKIIIFREINFTKMNSTFADLVCILNKPPNNKNNKISPNIYIPYFSPSLHNFLIYKLCMTWWHFPSLSASFHTISKPNLL